MADEGVRKSGLNAAWIARAKPKDKPYKLSDRDGLYLFIKPSGSRYWRMNYRFEGSQRTIAFGRYPEVPLIDAREKLREARALLAKGVDPVDQAKLERIANSMAAAHTFKAIADEWVEKSRLEKRSAKTIKKYEWQLGLVMSSLGKRPITKITTHEVLLALQRIERTQKYYTAVSVRSICSRVFRFAIATARAERDVCSDLRGALVTPKVVHRAAITTPKEAGALMRAIEEYDGDATSRIALRLLPHLFVRPGELRHAEWKEFDFDRRVWVIPSIR
jgi:hypothetical protein